MDEWLPLCDPPGCTERLLRSSFRLYLHLRSLSKDFHIFFPPSLHFSKELTDEKGGQNFLVMTISIMTTFWFFL